MSVAAAAALQASNRYDLRIHVFQARDVPAADSNGLADPYIVARIAGREMRTHVRRRAARMSAHTALPCLPFNPDTVRRKTPPPGVADEGCAVSRSRLSRASRAEGGTGCPAPPYPAITSSPCCV